VGGEIRWGEVVPSGGGKKLGGGEKSGRSPAGKKFKGEPVVKGGRMLNIGEKRKGCCWSRE